MRHDLYWEQGGKLQPFVEAVIGLCLVGQTDPEVMARLAGILICEGVPDTLWVEGLLDTPDRRIRHYLLHGLPKGHYQSVGRVKCIHCRHDIVVVPCVACLTNGLIPFSHTQRHPHRINKTSWREWCQVCDEPIAIPASRLGHPMTCQTCKEIASDQRRGERRANRPGTQAGRKAIVA